MSDKNYTVYHLHSSHSNATTTIDSVTKYNEYIDYAASLGMKAMAFSEHGNIMEWYHKKCAIEEKGMKYIHAVEAYVTEKLTSKDDKKIRDNYHCVLIATNYKSFKELNKLISKSFNRSNVNIVGNEDHYHYSPRITFEELINTSDDIIITSACIGGILNKGNDNIKKNFIEFMHKNKHRCYLEIQHHLVDDQIKYNKYLYELSKKYGIPLVAGTDTHALNEQHVNGRAILQKAKNIHFADEDGWDLTFKTYDELVDAYRKQNSLPMDVVLDAIENTNRIADRVKPFELDKNTKYPKIYKDPEKTYKDKINQAYKKHKYIKSRYSKNIIKKKVNEEMEVYKKTKSIDFMLLQNYVREWERENGIQCGYGRGSVSGSEIAYILGITEMDSLKFGLNFFRFMNPSRVTNADIDSDYSSKDRDKVKYFLLHDHMNLDNVKSSEIITFNTIALKGAIRDVGRALEMPLDEVDSICKKVDDDEYQLRKQYPELFKYVDIVNGTIVSIGSHPSGVLVSDLNIEEEVGLCSLSTSNYPVSMLNMKELDALMYVKLDILGLDNIGVINETCKLVGIERLTPDNVDLNDEKVWKSIRDDTTLIFQWESSSAQAYLKQFMSDETIKKAKEHNKDFSYIKWFSFGNGLIRPGCKDFRDEVAKGIVYNNNFKELDEFLSTTFGHVTMQEDIMQFLVKFCGYSDAESDTVRRGIAKKYGTEKLLPEIERRFIEYSSSHYNVTEEECQIIIKPFLQAILSASSYGFSWNHSDSYSCIGYICGYLRYYYPLEFITSALNIFKDNEEKTLSITKYAIKNGIKIKSIKFRKSNSEYTMSKNENAIYKGMQSIKYLSEDMSQELYSLRNNIYNSFIDLLVDIKKISVDARQMDILVKLDFFSEFGEPNTLLKQIEIFNEIYGKKTAKKKDDGKVHIGNYSLSLDKFRKVMVEDILQEGGIYKETAKQIKGFNCVKFIKAICNEIIYPKTTILDKMKYELDCLGYITSYDPSYRKRCYFVTEADVKKSIVNITLYEIYSGVTRNLKMWRNSFDRNPFDEKDIITIYKLEKKNKRERTGEVDPNTGKAIYAPVEGVFEYWLQNYSVEKGE